MPRADRREWLAVVKAALRRGASEEEAIRAGNICLNALLDADADMFRRVAPTAAILDFIEATGGHVGGVAAPAYARRLRDDDCDATSLDVFRHPQLFEAMRRRGGSKP